MNNHLKNLALSDTGFVFDPSTGNTYILNDTALFIVNALKNGASKEEILHSLQEEYEIQLEDPERDVNDLLIQLGEFGLWK